MSNDLCDQLSRRLQNIGVPRREMMECIVRSGPFNLQLQSFRNGDTLLFWNSQTERIAFIPRGPMDELMR